MCSSTLSIKAQYTDRVWNENIPFVKRQSYFILIDFICILNFSGHTRKKKPKQRNILESLPKSTLNQPSRRYILNKCLIKFYTSAFTFRKTQNIVGISISQEFSLPQTIWEDVPIDCESCTSMASAVHSNTLSHVITPSALSLFKL